MDESDPEQHRRAVAWCRIRNAVAALCVAVGLLADPLRGEPFSIGVHQAALIALGLVIHGLGRLSRAGLMRAGLVSSGLVIGLVLGELTVRIFFSAHYSTIYALHPEYLVSLMPNTRRIFSHHASNGGHQLLVEVNADGFLGEPAAPGRGTRIVVYGDSFVAGEFSRFDDRFTSQLAGALDRPGSGRVDVINAGVIGYGPDQILTRMASEVPRLEPALIVVGIYAGNDYGDLIRNKMFGLDASGKLERRPFEIAGSVRREFDEPRETTLYLSRTLRKGLDGLRRRAITGREGGFGWDLAGLHARSLDEYADYQRSGVVRNLLVDRYDADVAVAPEAPSSRYKRSLMDALLGRLGGLAEGLGVPLLVVVIPSPFDVCDDYQGTRASTDAYPSYRRRALVDPILASLRRHRIDHVDLFDPFREREAESLYFKLPDQHWNEAGQRLAAGLVAERILDSRFHTRGGHDAGGGGA